MDSQTLLNLGLVVAFVLVGGVFAATEVALISLRESQLTQIDRRGTRGARVAALARDPNRFLAAVQIGVTVAGFFSAAYGGATLAPDLAPNLEALGLDRDLSETVALIAMTLLIAYLSLVLGELVPKRLALQRSVGLSMVVAPALDRFAGLMRPFIWLLSKSTNALVRLVGGDPHATTEQLSEEELRELVTHHQALDELERRILHDVLRASDTTVKETMRPRGDVEFLSAETPLAEAADRIRSLPYSRYPITGDGVDDVIGFLHVRDLLWIARDDERRVFDVRRPVLMLPATNLVLPSVATMRSEGTHLAVVVDEYGGTDGIVTLEDLVEELIGDIRDEYDAEEPETLDGHPAGFDAGMSLEAFTQETGIALEDGTYETVAGFIIARLGRLPELGDAVEVEDAVLEVSELVGPRITHVLVRTVPQDR